MIFSYVSDPIKWEGMIFWILVQSDTVDNLILFVGHRDLYFMGQ